MKGLPKLDMLLLPKAAKRKIVLVAFIKLACHGVLPPRPTMPKARKTYPSLSFLPPCCCIGEHGDVKKGILSISSNLGE
jgi:hypothetical protein